MKQLHSSLENRGLWWINPVGCLTCFLVPIATVCLILPPAAYKTYWRSEKLYDAGSFGLCILAFASIIFGALAGQVIAGGRPSGPAHVAFTVASDNRFIKKALAVAIFFSMLGHLVWLAIMIHNGLRFGNLLAMLSGTQGASFTIRGYSEFIPGITTLMHLHVVVWMLASLLDWKYVSLSLRTGVLCVVAFTVFRALFNSERLALLEAAIPAGLLWVRFRGLLRRPALWLKLAPVILYAGLYVLFCLTEYNRYWVNSASSTREGFFSFAGFHLLGYYATALNNGALFMSLNMHSSAPTTVFNFIYNMPYVGNIIAALSGITYDIGDDLSLNKIGMVNRDFTNISGIFPVYMDLGIPLAVGLWVALGVVMGFCYQRYKSGSLRESLIFAYGFVGLLELPRIFYWSSTRAFYSWVFIFIVILMLSPRWGGVRHD